MGCWEWREGDMNCGSLVNGDGVDGVAVLLRRNCVKRWWKHEG